jgi:hypothetical protein
MRQFEIDALGPSEEYVRLSNRARFTVKNLGVVVAFIGQGLDRLFNDFKLSASLAALRWCSSLMPYRAQQPDHRPPIWTCCWERLGGVTGHVPARRRVPWLRVRCCRCRRAIYRWRP